jgi:hypothetical protein
MRIVPADSIPSHILHSDELRRVNAIGTSKDVPSVTLALALGAFYLTEDGPAWSAVYGESANRAERFRWLEVLKAGGKADELSKLFVAAIALPALAVDGLGRGWSWTMERLQSTPARFAAIAAAGGIATFVALKAPVEISRKIRSGLFFTGLALGELSRPYTEALNRFRQMAPVIPAWADLA